MGADRSIKTSKGETALDLATKEGCAEVVAILKNPEKVGAVGSPHQCAGHFLRDQTGSSFFVAERRTTSHPFGAC